MESSHVLPMRLFATWEVDRAGTDCVPRLCMLTVNRLTILRTLEADLTCFIIAVKLQGFKRTLRSNDIVVSASTNGVVDVDLDISFTLQYPHFVKQQSNCLLMMLQRRKKYKNRPMLGFKTLAVGTINLSNVLQHGVIRELALVSNDNPALVVGKVYFMSFVSQPVEQDEAKIKDQSEGTDEDDEEWSALDEAASDSENPVEDQLGVVGGLARKSTKSLASHPARFRRRQKNLKQKFIALLKKFKIPDEEIAEDEGADKKATEQEIEALFEELENLSDSGPEADDTVSIKSTPKPSLRPYFPSKEALPVLRDEASEESRESGESPADVTDDTSDALALPVAMPSELGGRRHSHDTGSGKFSSLLPHRLADKQQTLSFDEMMKATETPPAAGKKSRDEKRRSTSRHVSSVNPPTERLGLDRSSQSDTLSAFANTSKEFYSTPLDYAPVAQQLNMLFPPGPATFPDTLFVISAFDVRCAAFLRKLEDNRLSFAVISTYKETKALLSAFINRIQKLCNISSEQRQVIRICIVGADLFFSHWLKSFTELFGPRPNEWARYFRFYIISQSNAVIHKLIASIDRNYSSLFIADALWREWWDKSDLSDSDLNEVLNRILRYLASSAEISLSLPISEAMLHLKGKGSAEEVTQIFVPFIVEVRLAQPEGDVGTMDSGGYGVSPAHVITPFGSSVGPSRSENYFQSSPPSSPPVERLERQSSFAYVPLSAGDAKDLQIEYWSISGSSASASPGATTGFPISPRLVDTGNSRKDSTGLSKYSLKMLFRSMVVFKSPSCYSNPLAETPAPLATSQNYLTLQFVKERKKEKMLQKLGMRTKERIESEQRNQCIDGISRLICSTKQHTTLKLYIDGVEWNNVKFFQVSSQWQTHVKFFPVALVQSVADD